MNTAPILFLTFNRPSHTAAVFQRIREAKPEKLFLAADGPRSHVADDEEKCKKVKEIISEVNWDCEVHTLFREQNLGCGLAVSSAIDWFFSMVEGGVILEDDCNPSLQFFQFTAAMLEEYKNEKQVFHISGFSWVYEESFPHDFYFTRYPNIWGWATWADRWKKYNFSLEGQTIDKKLSWLEATKEEVFFHNYSFKSVLKENVDTWDYQWKFCLFQHRGICINPNANFIDNIGFDGEGTHTVQDKKLPLVSNNDLLSVDYRVPEIDLLMEKKHREKYLWPKANYFYTLFSFKQKVKDFLLNLYEVFRPN